MLGNYDEAKETYHESQRVHGEVYGKDHASYTAALSNLGMLEIGLVLESEAVYREEKMSNLIMVKAAATITRMKWRWEN